MNRTEVLFGLGKHVGKRAQGLQQGEWSTWYKFVFHLSVGNGDSQYLHIATDFWAKRAGPGSLARYKFDHHLTARTEGSFH